MSLEDHNDAKLMALVATGEMAALGELVRRHQDRAVSLAYRIVGESHLAEDVAQDAFLHVYRAAPTYRPDAKFTTWLYRIVTNLCLDSRRRAGRAPAPLPDPSVLSTPETAGSEAEAKERAEMVRVAVGQLPDRQRAALVLHRYERLSYAEVAEITGWSESAVESLIVRAYATLRRQLAQFEEK